MNRPRKFAPRTCESALRGLSDRMRGAAVLANFNQERARQLARVALLDVALYGAVAVRSNGGKK